MCPLFRPRSPTAAPRAPPLSAAAMVESESITSGQVLFGSFPLFIGDKAFAMDRTRLRKLNIRYIVNATPPLTSGGVANFFEKERELEYLRVPMRDAALLLDREHRPTQYSSVLGERCNYSMNSWKSVTVAKRTVKKALCRIGHARPRS